MNLLSILKYNPYHDEKGRFTNADRAFFVSTTNTRAVERMRQRARAAQPAETPEQAKARFLKKTMEELGNTEAVFNLSGDTLEAKAETWRQLTDGKVTPKEFVKAMTGGEGRGYNIRQTGRRQMSISGSYVKAFGANIDTYQRDFRLDENSVYHAYMVVNENERGTGVVKSIFKSAFPLYDKLGIKKVGVYAALDTGAYAWAKFGFKLKDESAARVFKSEAEYGLNRVQGYLDRFNAPREAYDELTAFRSMVSNSAAGNLYLNRQFVNFKTPAIDAALRSIPRTAWTVNKMQQDKATAAKLALWQGSWNGSLDMDPNSSDRKTLEAYVYGVRKTWKSFLALLTKDYA